MNTTCEKYSSFKNEVMFRFPGIFIFILLFCEGSYAQRVGIGSQPYSASAILDIQSSSRGLLIPRMTTSVIQSLSSPAKGLMVYDTIKNQIMVNMGTPVTPNWQNLIAKSGWELTGNQGIVLDSHYVGNTDNQPVKFRVNNIHTGELNDQNGNIFWGLRAGLSDTAGIDNIAIGADALRNSINGKDLIAIGDSALYTFTNCPVKNVGIGYKSLFANTCGHRNLAVGYETMVANTIGNDNTAIGTLAMHNNQYTSSNTSAGALAMYANMGEGNSCAGRASLYSNTEGTRNTAIGTHALFSNMLGSYNTAAGANALYYTTSDNNTGIGYNALLHASGDDNIAIGHVAGNTYLLGSDNILIGAGADVSFDNQTNSIAIGEGVVCPDNNTVRIGNSATWSIGGYANWTNFSDGRYKTHIQENVPGLNFIRLLQPVTYQLDVRQIAEDTGEGHGDDNFYIDQAMRDKEEKLFTGFIAQEVEEAASQLGFIFSGVDKPQIENGLYGLRYATFVVPLVKAVQELNTENQLLKSKLDEQDLIINDLLNRLKQLKDKNENYNPPIISE